MNRQELVGLQAIRENPCVSLIIPTHRHGPENQQDKIRAKNLLEEATRRLGETMGVREAAPLVAKLEAQLEAVIWSHTLDGLAVFASASHVSTHHVHVPVRERVVIDQTFATRELVVAMNRSQRYAVLVLSEKPTRLYVGALGALVEVEAHGFPMVHDGPGGAEPLPGGDGINVSAYRDERHRQFFRAVGQGVGAFLADEALPVVVCGVDRFVSFFREVGGKVDELGVLLGSYDGLSRHEVAKKVAPLVAEAFRQRRQAVLGRIDKAMGAHKAVTTFDEVWRAALDKRVEVLAVEEGHQVTGFLDASRRSLVTADDGEGVEVPDLIDEIVEHVIAGRGEVVFVDNGTLPDAHERMVAVVRY